MSDMFRNHNAFASEVVSITASSTPLTAATYNGSTGSGTSQREYPVGGGAGTATHRAQMAVLEAKGAIYYTLDGSTPTSTNSHALAAGANLTLFGNTKIANFRAIRQGGSNVDIYATYYR